MERKKGRDKQEQRVHYPQEYVCQLHLRCKAASFGASCEADILKDPVAGCALSVGYPLPAAKRLALRPPQTPAWPCIILQRASRYEPVLLRDQATLTLALPFATRPFQRQSLSIRIKNRFEPIHEDGTSQAFSLSASQKTETEACPSGGDCWGLRLGREQLARSRNTVRSVGWY